MALPHSPRHEFETGHTRGERRSPGNGNLCAGRPALSLPMQPAGSSSLAASNRGRPAQRAAPGLTVPSIGPRFRVRRCALKQRTPAGTVPAGVHRSRLSVFAARSYSAARVTCSNAESDSECPGTPAPRRRPSARRSTCLRAARVEVGRRLVVRHPLEDVLRLLGHACRACSAPARPSRSCRCGSCSRRPRRCAPRWR